MSDKPDTGRPVRQHRSGGGQPVHPANADPVIAPYGYCPKCGAKGKARERRLNGNDICENNHIYPSKDAVGG